MATPSHQSAQLEGPNRCGWFVFGEWIWGGWCESGVGATNDNTNYGPGDLHQGPGPGTTERAQLSYVMDFSMEAEIQEDNM
eukprot:scaffold36329_cov44-Attheya_sp.AAC.1